MPPLKQQKIMPVRHIPASVQKHHELDYFSPSQIALKAHYTEKKIPYKSKIQLSGMDTISFWHMQNLSLNLTEIQ
jgi:hypothetical protein